MKRSSLRRWKAASLTFMLPGLAGLIGSAMLSGHYLDTMPRWPVPELHRTVPRNIHGYVVYQTAAEDRRLDVAEYASVGVFLVGLGIGLAYLERWGSYQATDEEEAAIETAG